MDNLIIDIAEYLKTKGLKNVESFVNLEGDRTATFEHDGTKWLLSIEELYERGE